MTLQESRARLLSHFSGESSQSSKWEALWTANDFLPWDRGVANPALADILNDRQDDIGSCMLDDGKGGRRRKRAFVPGCGRGYDVLLLASFGYDAYGLEVSRTAVQRCIEEQERNGHKYLTRDEGVGAGKVNFCLGDFFSREWETDVEINEGMDLIYDYTFLSALPPGSRSDWALRMSQLLSAKGTLICIEFPSSKDPSAGGPPFALPPSVYVEHLAHPGRMISYDDAGCIIENQGQATDPLALKRKAHYRPKRIHKIGEGTDFVSFWSH